MSENKKGKDGPIDFGFSARASLETKISTEIPAQSTGRIVDAITDIFRPFSERRGLKADRIRLQREDVLLEIAQKALTRLQIEGREPSSIPNKFLVPFMEKASLEETGNMLVERWADLLASASTNPDSAHPRFVQLLSEITVNEAEILRQVAFHCIDEMRAPDQAFSDSPLDFQPKDVQENLQERLRSVRLNIDKIYELVGEMFEQPGVFLIDVMVVRRRRGKDPEFWSIPTDSPATLIKSNSIHVDVLYSLNLLGNFSIELSKGIFEIIVNYVSITKLGVEFLKKCDNDLNLKLSTKS